LASSSSNPQAPGNANAGQPVAKAPKNANPVLAATQAKFT